MKSYVVTLIDRETGEIERIRVQPEEGGCTCSCGMQEFVNSLTDLKIANPVVVDIHEVSVRCLPLVDPA